MKLTKTQARRVRRAGQFLFYVVLVAIAAAVVSSTWFALVWADDLFMGG